MEKVKEPVLHLYEVCGGGYLRCKDVEALLKTPEAQRQLAAVKRLSERRVWKK